jgi:Na+-driven multidrug efflux pump
LLALGRSGVLVALRTGVLLLALTFAAATATRIGAAEIAAHQVVMQVWLLAAMIADSFAIAGQAMVGDAVGAGDRLGTDRLSWRLLLWGGVTGLVLLSVFFVGNPLLALLVDDPQVADLTVSAGEVAGWMMPVAAPLFVADGVFFGLLALGTVVASTSFGAVVVVLLISLTPLGDSLDGIWWAIAAMLVARGLVYLFAYRRSVEAAVRS